MTGLENIVHLYNGILFSYKRMESCQLWQSGKNVKTENTLNEISCSEKNKDFMMPFMWYLKMLF